MLDHELTHTLVDLETEQVVEDAIRACYDDIPVLQIFHIHLRIIRRVLAHIVLLSQYSFKFLQLLNASPGFQLLELLFVWHYGQLVGDVKGMLLLFRSHRSVSFTVPESYYHKPTISQVCYMELIIVPYTHYCCGTSDINAIRV